jgi:hypothetical protein
MDQHCAEKSFSDQFVVPPSQSMTKVDVTEPAAQPTNQADAGVTNPAGYNFVGPTLGGPCRQANGQEPPLVRKESEAYGFNPLCGSDTFSQCRSQDLVNYCAGECNTDSNCHSFSVLHGRGDCLLYIGGGKCDPNATTPEWWWKVYAKQQATPPAEISEDAAKVEASEEISKGQVFNTQVAQRCAWTTGMAGYVKSQNIEVSRDAKLTVEECKARCNSISQCKSIDYGGAHGSCFLNYCRIGEGDCVNGNPGDTTYQYYSCEADGAQETSTLVATVASPLQDTLTEGAVATTSQAEFWRVAWEGGVRVRSQADLTSPLVALKKYGEVVRGSEHDGWLKLGDSPGFMKVKNDETNEQWLVKFQAEE